MTSVKSQYVASYWRSDRITDKQSDMFIHFIIKKLISPFQHFICELMHIVKEDRGLIT